MSGINEDGKNMVVDLMSAVKAPLCDLDQVAEMCLSLTHGKGVKLVNGVCIPVDNGFSAVIG